MPKRIFTFLFLGICIETIQLQAINWFIPRSKTIDPVLALFLKKYAPPADVIKCLDKVQKEQQFGFNKKLPGYFLKGGDTNRLLNAIRLKNLIEKENLTTLDVPEKYIYCKDDQCTVIAQFIESIEGQTVTPEIAEQLLTVAEKTGFWNWYNNIVPDKEGKLWFVDTEDIGFAPVKNSVADFPSGTAVQSVGDLYNQVGGKKIRERLNVLINDKEASTKVITPIYDNNTLDSEDFDLQEIRALLNDYKNEKIAYELNHELMCSLGNQFE
ncbi:MAG TPA: hypothetical protein VL201_00575 [Patescibacteria group bacterium]|jgi:hypothetical protein|nr:hypothetical protein [Patescibacteria group bacterium]